MDKITKKELLEKLGFSDLSDEALEKIFGGEGDGDIDGIKMDDTCRACVLKNKYVSLSKALFDCKQAGSCHD